MSATYALADIYGPGDGYDPDSPGDPDGSYRVVTSVYPNGAGWTSVSGGDMHKSGESVTVYASSSENYQFEGWYENDSKVSASEYYQFTMPAHKVELNAKYEVKSPGEPMAEGYTHTVIVTVDPENGGSVSNGNRFQMKEGETIEIYANPKTGYKFNGWKLNGENITPNSDGTLKNPLQLTMGKENIHLRARFSYSPKDPGDPFPNSYNRETFELIIDNFEPNYIYDAINNIISDKRYNINRSEIHSIIIAGKMGSYDENFGVGLTNCASVDLARTSGLTELYETPLSEMKPLTELILPASLTYMSYHCMVNNSNLKSITCYAPIPPVTNSEYFGGFDYSIGGVADGVVAYVPAASIPLYKEADGWKHFNLVPIESSDCQIIVTLPQEAADGRYKGMYLVLENPASGQTQRFVINDRLVYVFENMIMSTPEIDMVYNVFLRNGAGENLASYPDITLTENKKVADISFDKIKSINTLTAKVLQDDGKDIAGELQITWKNADGNYLATGVSLPNVVEGKTVTANVTLNDNYGQNYKAPSPVKVTAGQGGNLAEIHLSPYAKKVAEGKVTDAYTQQGIEKAYVTVEQTVAGKYRKNATGITDAEGKYRVEYIADASVPGKVTARHEKYVTQPCEIKNFEDWDEMKDFELKLISGAVVNITLNWTPAGEIQSKAYSDYANVDFTLYNKTKQLPIQYFSNQYPMLVILDDAEENDEIEVNVVSRTGVFESQTAAGKLDDKKEVSVTVNLQEHGKIKSTVSPSEFEINALLYNENGNLMKHMLYNSAQSVTFSNLKEGKYTLVALADSPYLTGTGTLSDFSNYGLIEGEDYILKEVEIKDGELKTLDLGNISKFDESRFYYADASKTQVKVNKTSVTAGNYVTLSTKFEFLNQYKGRMENVKLVYDFPEDCLYVEGSLVNGDEVGNLTQEKANQYSLEKVTPGTSVRFCLMPEKGGNYYPSVNLEFDYNGQHFTQPLGTAYFQGVDFKLYVPAKTSKESIYARGVATAGSDVNVFVMGMPSGAAKAGGNGEWVAEVKLMEPEIYKLQQLYGEIVTGTKGTFPTESILLEYDPSYPELNYTKMLHNGQEVNFYHTKGKTSSKSYSYDPSRDMFTLMAKFDSNSDKVKSVNFHLMNTDGSERVIDAVYSSASDSWMAALGYPDSFRLPVNVTVDFAYERYDSNGATEQTESYMDYIAPDVQPIIDPSGFVYEANEDNRVEGATVTVFYREGVENMYGDVEWKTSKWDATEYGQENPLFTDEEGLYGWDVPQGEWQVKYEKAGFETVYSQWLKVPPPQLEVNMNLTRNDAPQVKEVHAYNGSNGVSISFDHFMDFDSLKENIHITKESAVADGDPEIINGTLTVLSSEDEENPDENGTEAPADGSQYIDRVRFIPEKALASTDLEVRLFISKNVKSYAGISMYEDYDEPISLEKEITELASNYPEIELEEGEELEVVVSAIPADAAVGKELTISNQSPYVVEMSKTATSDVLSYENSLNLILDENGQAKIYLKGITYGQSKLDLSVKGSDVVCVTPVDVVKESLKVAIPIASLPHKSQVYRGALTSLSCKNEGAVIYYTLDGSQPSETNGFKYTSPIKVEDDITLRAVAILNGKISEIAEFQYLLKRGLQNLSINEGWSWISHNMESPVAIDKTLSGNIQRIVSQVAEVTNDTKYGFVGNLKELSPQKSYKVQCKKSDFIALEDVAYNPTTPISLNQGWNWIGYPIDEVRALDEAFDLEDCEEGDYIQTLDGGFATFNDGGWIGTLTSKGMIPGSGYLYKSVSAKNIHYNTGLVSNAASILAIQPRLSSAWAADKTAYSSIMPAICEVKLENNEIAEDGVYDVAAFSGTECRGVGQYQDGYLFITIYGEAGDEIDFQLMDNETGSVRMLKNGLQFAEEPLGSVAEPYILDLSRSGVKSLYGNNDVKVLVSNRYLHVEGISPEHVDVYNLQGNKVFTTNQVESVLLLDVTPNIYVVAVKDSGKWSYHKIMVD